MYEMLRGERAGRTDVEVYRPAAEPEPCTGRRVLQNAVITRLGDGDAAGTHRCELLVDTSDPTFFDLPLDHVPGLMLLEAMRQAATATACRQLRVGPETVHVHEANLGFSRFAEYDAPVSIDTSLDETASVVSIRLHQAGKTLSEGTVGVVRV
jgi:hypothetical protein